MEGTKKSVDNVHTLRLGSDRTGKDGLTVAVAVGVAEDREDGRRRVLITAEVTTDPSGIGRWRGRVLCGDPVWEWPHAVVLEGDANEAFVG